MGAGPFNMADHDPERITWTNIRLIRILMMAYDLPADRISGPGWLDSELYDIVAAVPRGTSVRDFKLMGSEPAGGAIQACTPSRDQGGSRLCLGGRQGWTKDKGIAERAPTGCCRCEREQTRLRRQRVQSAHNRGRERFSGSPSGKLGFSSRSRLFSDDQGERHVSRDGIEPVDVDNCQISGDGCGNTRRRSHRLDRKIRFSPGVQAKPSWRNG